MFKIDSIQRSKRDKLHGLWIMLAILGLIGLPAYPVHAQTCAFPAMVSNQAELDAAITCYGAVTTPGAYVITLTGNIDLSISPPDISNPSDGVSLVLDGANQTVRGQHGVQPFMVTANTEVTIQNIVITGSHHDGVNTGGAIENDGLLTVRDSTITENSSYAGGGIYNRGNLTLYHSTVSNNGAYVGGGISNNGVMALYNTTVSENRGSYVGGIENNGVLTVVDSIIRSNNGDAIGGGIYNDDQLTITASSIISNTTGQTGGGIFNRGRLTSINNTISGNRANLFGGGLDSYGGSLTIINSTFSHNTAGEGSGIYNQTAQMYMVNTILANNLPSGNDCLLIGDIYEEWMSPDIGNNLIESTGEGACRIPAGSNGNVMGQSAQLGPLQDNSGPTLTHALLDGSPALDAGNNAICADPATVNGQDQRGVTRPQGAACDIGAFEREVASPQTLYQQVLAVRASLAALLPSGDSKTDKALQKAMTRLDQALAATLWDADGNHLTLLGEMAFHRLREAVKELAKLKNPPQVVLDAINTLLTVTRTLAETALQEAVASNAKLRAKAQKEMSKAQQDLAKNQPANAISHYEEAWEYAQKAVGNPIIAASTVPDDDVEDEDHEQEEPHVHDEADAAENETQINQIFLPLVNR